MGRHHEGGGGPQLAQRRQHERCVEARHDRQRAPGEQRRDRCAHRGGVRRRCADEVDVARARCPQVDLVVVPRPRPLLAEEPTVTPLGQPVVPEV